MKDKNKGYWQKSEKLRNSMPDMLSKDLKTELYGYEDESQDETIIQRINRKLYQYKEIKLLCKKTHIQGFYYLIILIICLIFILIGYCGHYLTIIIGTLYPLYMSFKTLHFRIGEEKSDGTRYDEYDERNDIIQWLSYWIIFSIFIDLESAIGHILKKVPLYFFAKIVFLLLCYLPQYQLAEWLYIKIVRKIFSKYEERVTNIAKEFIRKLTAETKKNKKMSNSAPIK